MLINEQDLKKTSYLVVVKILEARDLKGESTGGVNPYVKIQCGNLEPQQTKTVFMTSTAIWNQSFTFPDLKMNKYELESLELLLTVYDQNNWWTNQEIGSYSIGLSTMYRYPNGDLHKKWIRLARNEQPTKAVGYLQVSCFIVGPGQDPPVHDEMDGYGESMAQQMRREGVNPDAILERQKALQGLAIVDAPKLNQIPYQLIVNIYKGENLCELANGEFPNAFITVRSQNCTQDTRTNKNGGNPNWQQKIQIPVYTPTYNEKIRVTVWHNAGEMLDYADLFIANVPELPNSHDVMNIAALHSREGRMAPMWFNLYGNRHKEYDNSEPRLYSTAFMGRVLMSLHLQTNTRPTLSTSSSQIPAKVHDKNYKLWIDVYDLVNCTDLLSRHKAPTCVVTIQAFINGKSSEKLTAQKATIDSTSFTFQQSKKNPQHQLDIAELSLPQDVNQIPHLFVNVNITTYPSDYDPIKNKDHKGKFTNERVGFIRLVPKDIYAENEKDSRPTWHEVHSILSRKKTEGRMLVNARLLLKDNETRREFKPRGRDVQYHFLAQIFSGYQLAPNIPEQDLKTRVEIKIGNSGAVQQKSKNKKSESKDIKTGTQPGRFPSWNHSEKARMVTMSDVAEFASDMRVQLFQKEESMLKGRNYKMIGQFLVPISSMVNNQLYKRPQYFNVIDNDGNMQGKILARFYLIKRDPQQQDEEMVTKTSKYMQQMVKKKPFVVNLKVSILGLRSLAYGANNSQMEISLTNYEKYHGITVQEAYQNEQNKKKHDSDYEGAHMIETDDEEKGIMKEEQRKIKMDGVKYLPDGTVLINQLKPDNDERKPTKNPNYGKVLCFEKLQLQEDMILWPHLVIKYYDQGKGSKNAPNVENSRIVLPIFIFAGSFMDEASIKIALAMLMETSSSEHQKQDNPLQIYMSQLLKQLQIENLDSIPRDFNLQLSGREEVYTQLLQDVNVNLSVRKIMKLFGLDDDLIADPTNEHKDQLSLKDAAKDHRKNNEDDGIEGDRAQDKKGKHGKKYQEEDEESDIDRDDFKDLKDIWKEFLNNANDNNKGGDLNKGVAKNKKKGTGVEGKEGDEEDEDIQAILGGNDDGPGIGLHISKFEEDPVIPNFIITNHVCTERDKEKERDEKNERKKKLEKILQDLQQIQNHLPNNSDFKETVRLQLMNCRQKIVDLERKEVTEEEFIQGADSDEEHNNADIYGKREIYQGPLESHLDQIIPFMTLPMIQEQFNSVMFTTDNYSYTHGIFTAGKPNGSIIRFAVNLEKGLDDDYGLDKHGRHQSKKRQKGSDDSDDISRDSATRSEEEDISDVGSDQEDHQRLTIGQPGWQSELQNNPEEHKRKDELEKVSQEIEAQRDIDDNFRRFVIDPKTTAEQVIQRMHKDNYKIDIFRPSTILAMVQDYEYTLRIFVRACQNLSAVDNRVNNWRNVLAGDRALSSADPFLMMRIVSGDEVDEFHNGRERAHEETLNPTFDEAEEKYPIRLQEMWQLEIEVRDKGSLQLRDTVIGSTIIDLEQRRWSMQYALAKLTLQQEILKCDEEIRECKKINQNYRKKGSTVQDLKVQFLVQRIPKLKEALAKFKAKKEMPQQHVEYRPLMHPEKDQAQGMAELWVEVLDVEEARLVQFHKAKERKQDENFQVRLIIWETRDVPAPNGSVMDAQITASYQPQGLSQEIVEKLTDTHSGCKDGRALFNYRMVFNIGRDESPRLKLQVRDTGFTTNEAIGEITLDLRESIRLLKRFGVLEDNRIFLPFTNPSKDGAEMGHCLVQIQVLAEADAMSEPVGDGQDEPNINPTLVRPVEGRGVGDKLAGLGLSLPDVGLPDLYAMIRKGLIALFVLIASMLVLFVIINSV